MRKGPLPAYWAAQKEMKYQQERQVLDLGETGTRCPGCYNSCAPDLTKNSSGDDRPEDDIGTREPLISLYHRSTLLPSCV